ncbi:MAG: lysine 5,6-aminomutase subunit alpha [Fervidobacterium sp.]|nr:lysine 5,6-aminomutase subunit alpha [Fervidobacterium sp.]
MSEVFESKLGIDPKKVERARQLAKDIAVDVVKFVKKYSTVSVERTICRFFGIDGVTSDDIPLPNVVVDHLKEKGALQNGVTLYIGNAMLETGMEPQEIAQEVANGKLDLTKLPMHSMSEIKDVIDELSQKAVKKVDEKKSERKMLLEKLGDPLQPYIYVIVATGNIYEDVVQAQAAVRQGADIIAVIRSTAQSLLDYVPYGATTEGFGGTFATQENFRIMRKALDEVANEVGRYIRQTNYSSGLCMPEIAALGALERLDVMLNDALYGILFRDINMIRTMVDQYFSRIILGYAGIIINTGEDNYLTTADAYEQGYTVISSQLINEQLALLAGIPEEQMGLGHAFEMDPSLENGFLYELAQAQLSRELFPKAPLKYMPPTRFMTGNIFRGLVQDAMFNVVGIWTKQGIQLLGMMTEAIHTPFLSDRYIAIDTAKYIFNNMKNIGDEIVFKPGGIIQRRAQEVLDQAIELLEKMREDGLFKSLEKGVFANTKRSMKGGKGLDGVFEKGKYYYNPFEEKMNPKAEI